MHQHDPRLHSHSLRVGLLANDYYRFCGMPYEQGWDLVEGAVLHDVGKICIDSDILNRPRQLNESEKRIVSMHPVIGAELLKSEDHFSRPVLNIVRHHHERLDGSGYPDGWRGRRTSKLVRIVAACDAFCAMTEDRPYEDAWPWREALDRLKSMQFQYDLKIATVLEKMLIERGTSISLRERITSPEPRSGKRASGVQRPRSAFFAPKYRHGLGPIQ